ncbi:N-acetyltransferase [Hyphomicrobium sp. LHD-15]|uniref:GNAT family N-acetyltransferase n=1 Tax=Hyphomicrobium sp. LHD-15 TaxID=3072142 RepID=UPI00281075AB|nr:N-acetyltransferase [Hyphomicrobium sp. LHD-15]MDQ8698900.1 N-acetyltransferase [Hyphomicrobium sp. LHD-15]
MALTIRAFRPDDAYAVWELLEPVIRAGETYALARTLTRAEALGYWTGADREAFVAEAGGRVVGTYYLKANQAGGGSHVANCGYVSAQDQTGKGIARAMCSHSLAAARERGFRAMQFNLVVSTNTRAVELWKSLGFEIVGQLTRAFQHPVHGEVDAFVMYRLL